MFSLSFTIYIQIKKEYAENHGLDFVHLLGTDQYKEIHRKAMVDWSEEVRSEREEQ